MLLCKNCDAPACTAVAQSRLDTGGAGALLALLMPAAPVSRPALILADRWEEYQLLDCGDGMKQERWGDYVLVRPDPQIIWPRRAGREWRDWDGFYHRSDKGGGRWENKRPLPESWHLRFAPLSLTFRIHPTSFKHTGLFPEQAVNWEWSAGLITAARAAGREVSVLNLFGYTGAATCAAARAGAAVTHVDAAEGMVRWCRENAALCGLAAAPIRYIVDDCLKFVRREQKRGKRYDAIIMDPPTYGRGSTGEMWKLEEDLWPLLSECRDLLSPQPLFFLINAYTARLSPTVVVNLLTELMHGRGGRSRAARWACPSRPMARCCPAAFTDAGRHEASSSRSCWA